ncbi:indolepyruvate oxidoreductase subunit beta family protein [Piscinibacter sakaiensis]|uniref:indolepyruvate oxidoreductase subunit beta family protein n=1 Tax=Piscinibacter sakaiensis TaxID=1547922 RepID=UPI003AB0086A
MSNGSVQPIKIAILAMGGEGGGVLADWIVDLGEHNGYLAQSTSVAGVAQRTGATIYYLELFPRAAAEAAGAEPVLSLIPTPGDVDVLIASELMEAGRAVQRGLVTPDRTTLIASTHRVYAIAEKSAMGNGVADSRTIEAACIDAAKTFVRFDMAAVTEQTGSVISAVMFGALCGAAVLPFSREAFEATIQRGGVGVAASLRAFGEGAARASETPPPIAEPASAPLRPLPERHDHPEVDALLQRLQRDFAPAEQPLIGEGVRRLVDYQDPAYAGLYLDRVAAIQRHGDPALTAEVARHLALWMSYEDTVRVAELKVRATRFERVRGEARVGEQQLLQINEFLHPRLQEICDTLPAALGRWLLQSGAPRRLVERFTQHGRIVQTSSLRGFLLLYTLAGLRRWRRGSLRYQVENARIEDWLARISAAASTDPALALEIARCQRLVKGYSDTHERGTRNFDKLMGACERLAGKPEAAAALRRLRDAALADEHGHALDAALAGI